MCLTIPNSGALTMTTPTGFALQAYLIILGPWATYAFVLCAKCWRARPRNQAGPSSAISGWLADIIILATACWTGKLPMDRRPIRIKVTTRQHLLVRRRADLDIVSLNAFTILPLPIIPTHRAGKTCPRAECARSTSADAALERDSQEAVFEAGEKYQAAGFGTRLSNALKKKAP